MNISWKNCCFSESEHLSQLLISIQSQPGQVGKYIFSQWIRYICYIYIHYKDEKAKVQIEDLRHELTKAQVDCLATVSLCIPLNMV